MISPFSLFDGIPIVDDIAYPVQRPPRGQLECGVTGELRAYDGLAHGELEHAVSKAASSPLPRHRIGILMSPEGRFLECAACQISFKFPDGAQFDVIAKEFEFHLCGPPMDIPSWGREHRFVIVRHEGKVPMMASCAKCQLKFFTPATFACDAVGAELYLLDKFDLHECKIRTDALR